MRIALLIGVLASLPLAASVFEGRVVEDHNGNPLPRVEIRITRPGADDIVDESETDAQGRFRTPELPDDRYLVHFSKTNFSTLEVTTTPRMGLQMRLIHFAAISGRVYHVDGSPALDFNKGSVFAVDSAGLKAGRSDRNSRPGEYRIYGLLPGKYRVAMSDLQADGGRPAHGILFQPNNLQPREFAISGGEDYNNVDLNLPMTVAYAIRGKIEMPAEAIGVGLPPRTAMIYTVSTDLPGTSFKFVTTRNEDGLFSISDLMPGNYEVLVASSDGNKPLFARASVSVSAGNVENVRLAPAPGRSATITLRVQEPCRGSVEIQLKTMEDWPDNSFSGTVTAEKPDKLVGLPPARFQILPTGMEGNCYASAPASLDLTRESSKSVEVVLQPAGSIRGKIFGATPGHLVVLTAPDGAQQIAIPDLGEFAFANLRPGSYTVMAAGAATRWMLPPGRMPAPVEVSAGPPTEVTLRIQEAQQ